MKALVVGASGGIGGALVKRLADDPRFDTIHALSRRSVEVASERVRAGLIDIADPESIKGTLSAIEEPVDLTLIATGMLHDGSRGPERALKELQADWLAENFAINTIGPALVLQQVAPLLPRTDRGVIAALSARVGSISDNHAGGWYGYRAAKAALNMVIRCAAIELARSRPEAICVGLHPGTVDSGLSRPFQANVPAEKLFTPDYAAGRLLTVLEGLTSSQSGRCFAWDGSEIAP